MGDDDRDMGPGVGRGIQLTCSSCLCGINLQLRRTGGSLKGAVSLRPAKSQTPNVENLRSYALYALSRNYCSYALYALRRAWYRAIFVEAQPESFMAPCRKVLFSPIVRPGFEPGPTRMVSGASTKSTNP